MALDGFLSPSPPPTAARLAPAIDLGSRLLGIDLVDLPDAGCPAPIGTLGFAETAVAFVMPGSPASRAQLEHLSRAGSLVAVVDGASRDEAEKLVAGLGDDVLAVPDPDGQIAGRLGVSYWPTTVSVNQLGVVTRHQVGLDPRARSRERST